MKLIMSVVLLQTVLSPVEGTADGKVPKSDVILSFPREFGYRAASGTYDKLCALRFDPSNTFKQSTKGANQGGQDTSLVSDDNTKKLETVPGSSTAADTKIARHSDDGHIDIFNNPNVLSMFAAHWKSEATAFCVAQPDNLTANGIIKKARLTRSEFKDQPTLHCTVEESGPSSSRTIRYVLPRLYTNDVLVMKRIADAKYFSSGTTEVPAGKLESDFIFTDEYNTPGVAGSKADEKPDQATQANDKVSSADKNRYFANVWCHAVLLRVKEVEAGIQKFVDSYNAMKPEDRAAAPRSSSTPEGPNVLEIEYSHGAKFSKKDGQCSITMYTIDKENEAVLPRYHDLIHMNSQGLCFGGTTLDEVPDFKEPSEWSADLEMDPHSQNPNLKCFHQSAPGGPRQLIAEYRLPFAYSASQPLQQSPKSYKDDKAQADTTSEAQVEPQADEKTHSKFWMGGTLGQISSFMSRNRPFKGDKPPNAITFMDKYHDATEGIDKTAIRGIGVMAAKYCAHLNYMKEAFLVASADNFMQEFSKHLQEVRVKTYARKAFVKPVEKLAELVGDDGKKENTASSGAQKDNNSLFGRFFGGGK